MHNGLLLSGVCLPGGGGAVVPIAKRLGLSSVLGYLVAGVVIGPVCVRLCRTRGRCDLRRVWRGDDALLGWRNCNLLCYGDCASRFWDRRRLAGGSLTWSSPSSVSWDFPGKWLWRLA